LVPYRHARGAGADYSGASYWRTRGRGVHVRARADLRIESKSKNDAETQRRRETRGENLPRRQSAHFSSVCSPRFAPRLRVSASKVFGRLETVQQLRVLRETLQYLDDFAAAKSGAH